MASTTLLVVVFVFDVVAFALAVAAEQRRSSARVVEAANSKYCVYESDTATSLGVWALFFLLASQLLIMFASRCMCFGRPLRPGSSRAMTIFLFIACWLTFIIAEICLLTGSVKNAYHTKYRTYLTENPPSCETLRKGVFGAGAAFVVFTGILSELYYVYHSESDERVLPDTGNREVMMADI